MMKTQKGKNNSLLVFLNKHEAVAYHIGADMHPETEESRRMMHLIFREAAALANYPQEMQGKKIIEILPFEDGSVLLCFTPETIRPRLKIRVRRKEQHSVYEFENGSALERFLESAEALSLLPEAVCKSEGKYRFIMRGDNRRHLLLTEFATRLNAPLAVARTEEYWQKLY